MSYVYSYCDNDNDNDFSNDSMIILSTLEAIMVMIKGQARDPHIRKKKLLQINYGMFKCSKITCKHHS